MTDGLPPQGIVSYNRAEMEAEYELLLGSLRTPIPGGAFWFTGEPMISVKGCEENNPDCYSHFMIQGEVDPVIAGADGALWYVIGYVDPNNNWIVVPEPGMQMTVQSMYEAKGYTVQGGYVDKDQADAAGLGGGGQITEITEEQFLDLFYQNKNDDNNEEN